jgi:hypothetical protein
VGQWLACLLLDSRLNPANCDGLRAIKIRSTHSFLGEVKPSHPRRKILRHVTQPFKVRKRYFVRQNVSFPSPVPSVLLLGDSTGTIARELWCTNQEFSPVNIIPTPIPVARGLRRRSATTSLLGSRVRIPLGEWMIVSCVYMLCCPV